MSSIMPEVIKYLQSRKCRLFMEMFYNVVFKQEEIMSTGFGKRLKKLSQTKRCGPFRNSDLTAGAILYSKKVTGCLSTGLL